MTRRSVWSKSEIQKLLRQFVPATDEVGRLQRGRDPECKLFQSFCDLGHYKGRGKGTTRQGMYAVAPSGVFLASCNTRHAHVMEKMMRRALTKWRDMPKDQRYLDKDKQDRVRRTKRWEDKCPTDGLILQVSTRDLPRKKNNDKLGKRDWRRHAWNIDFAWFTKAEAKDFVPDPAPVGARHAVPQRIVGRLVMLHLIDNVRGQVSPFRKQDVKKARLSATVLKVTDKLVKLRLAGETRAVRRGKWRIHGLKRTKATDQELGFTTQLLGYATFDYAKSKFTHFELVGVGERWGAQRFNARTDDLGKNPIGVVLRLSSPKESGCVAPARIWNYGWKW